MGECISKHLARPRRLATCLVTTALLTTLSCGDPTVVLPETLGIVAVAPAHGAVGINTNVTIHVVLTQALDSGLDLDKYFVLLRDADDQELVTTLTLSDDGFTVSMAPDSPLAADTIYRVRITADLPAADSSIAHLPVDVETLFTTGP